MSNSGHTFSESWHRVADLKLSLHPSVRIRKQLIRNQTWYIVRDPFNNDFFRLRQEAYNFVVRLRPDRTIAEVWHQLMDFNPAETPGQDEVIRLLAQLHQANLLNSKLPADSGKLFAQVRKRRQQLVKSKLLSLMFLRLPLLDPDPFLRRSQRLVQLFTGRLAIALWLACLLFGLSAILENWPQVQAEANGLLAFDNLLLLYFGLVIAKGMHEIGHTLVCRRFGGEVHVIGIMLIFFAPLPYMDATASWAFRRRRERVLVSSAGMFYELFIAFLAALFWANSAPGALHSLAFNIMIIASVSTLAFNLNPLLRYDGYYILSDLLDIPNLQTRATRELKHLAKRHLYGLSSLSDCQTRQERYWLIAYAISSGIYRVLIYGAILLYIADRFLILGLLMTAFCLITWGILPALRFAHFLFLGAELESRRQRAVAVTFILFLGVLCGSYILPVPHRFTAPGIVEASRHQQVINQVPGRISRILVASGTRVQAGTPLILLENRELEIEERKVMAQQREVNSLLTRSIALHASETQRLLEERLASLQQRHRQLREKLTQLQIRAGHEGVWISPTSHELPGTWLKRGSELGRIVSTERYRFSAVISQEDVSHLVDGRLKNDIRVRLAGETDLDLSVTEFDFIPYQHSKLPSAALGWSGGGKIPTRSEDDQGLQTVEPFFLLHAVLDRHDQAKLHHGQSGKIRFTLHNKPLLQQLLRLARQYFQKRYQS